MNRRLLYLLLLLPLGIFAKPKQATIDCNTIFVCIDSLSYATLFDNPFIRDTLFICREQQTTTSNDAYTGKYAIGKAATLEFFKPVPASEKNGTLTFQVDRDWGGGYEYKGRYKVYANGQLRAASSRQFDNGDKTTPLKSPKPRIKHGDPVQSVVNMMTDAMDAAIPST